MPGYDRELIELRTAKAWGLTPLQWRQQSPDDQALMLTLDMFESTRESYRDEWREKKMDKNKNHGANDYAEMKRRMAIK